MVSNQSRPEFRALARQYPGRIGHLFSPGGQRRPTDGMPWALDNGAFPIWSRGGTWDESEYLRLLDWAANQDTAPEWVLIPDVVGSRDGTVAAWHRWAYRVSEYGWPLAFALQDGMTAMDIPEDADVAFLGGSTRWKLHTLGRWGARLNIPLHVGRVNSVRFLWRCVEAGAQSVDGTGWWHQNDRQLFGLEQFCREYKNGHRDGHHAQRWMFTDANR